MLGVARNREQEGTAEGFVQLSNWPTQAKNGLSGPPFPFVEPVLIVLSLDPQPGAESARGIVRFRTVVIHKNGVEAAITKQRAAEFSDSRRCLHPARGFCVDLSELLQPSILLFG